MLDKSVVKQLIDNCGLNDAVPIIYAKELQEFAQAIYEMGVKDERESKDDGYCGRCNRNVKWIE